MILLDTCALLWLAHEKENLSEETLSRIDASPSVSISGVTGYEIGLKCRSGKLVLPLPPEGWRRSSITMAST